MYGRFEVGSEQNSLSFLSALVRSIFIGSLAIGVSLNIVEVGLSIMKMISWQS